MPYMTPTVEDAEQALLAGLAGGRQDCLGALYELYADRLFRTAWGLIGDHSEAEDAVQDVFVSLVRGRKVFGEVTQLTAYVFTALRHAARRRGSALARGPRLLGELPEAADPQAERAGVEGDPALEQALAALPNSQREVLLLKIDGGLTLGEIALVLGVSPNTAASRYRYALEKLRDQLEDPADAD